jgi:hypothetical protein
VPLPQETPQVAASMRELSIARIDGQVAIDIGGEKPERILFAPSEARKLIAEIERALNRGFGRDIDAIREIIASAEQTEMSN